MKIHDDALIQAIWTLQLKCLSRDVLHHYVGGKYGLVDESWFLIASDIHTCERHLITPKLGKQQIYKRLRKLIEQKYVSWAHKPNTFFIDTVQAKEAFTAAREFWLSKGVPEGFTTTKVIGRTTCCAESRCVPLDKAEYVKLVDECFEHLQSQFRSVDWTELTERVFKHRENSNGVDVCNRLLSLQERIAYQEALIEYLDKKIKCATTCAPACVPFLLEEALERTHFSFKVPSVRINLEGEVSQGRAKGGIVTSDKTYRFGEK